MVDPREPIDSLIASPSRFTARLGQTEEYLVAYALVLGRERE